MEKKNRNKKCYYCGNEFKNDMNYLKKERKKIKKYHLSIKGDAGESQGILCHFKFLSVQVFVKRPFAG